MSIRVAQRSLLESGRQLTSSHVKVGVGIRFTLKLDAPDSKELEVIFSLGVLHTGLSRRRPWILEAAST